MNPTLEDWKNTTSLGLVEQLPLQDYDAALMKVEAYLANVGGWNPDDSNDPTGPGLPVNGAIPSDAIPTIVEDNYNRIYVSNIDATIGINMSYVNNTQSGMTDTDLLNAIESEVEDFIKSKLVDLPISFVSLDSYIGTVTNEGLTTTTNRIDIDQEVQGQDLVDPRAIALDEARKRYALSTNWNVYGIYTESSNDLIATIRRYTDVTYATEDNLETNQYIIKLDSTSFTVVSGLYRPIQI